MYISLGSGSGSAEQLFVPERTCYMPSITAEQHDLAGHQHRNSVLFFEIPVIMVRNAITKVVIPGHPTEGSSLLPRTR